MKDKLEEFVINNRDKFNNLEPNEKLWNNIKKSINRSSSFNFRTFIFRVAAVVVIFITSYYFHEYNQIRKSNKITSKDMSRQNRETLSTELLETKAYYAGLVSSKMKELKIVTANNPDIEKNIEYDLSELDSAYTDIKKDLKDNVANNEVVEALIQSYRLKLKILEDLLTQLEQKSNKNIRQNETEIHEI